MYIWMHDLPHLHHFPCSNSVPIALCISMWMHVHGIKIKQHKLNSNSNMWEANQQLNMWNRSFESIKNMEKRLNRSIHVKAKAKTNK